MHKGHNPRFLLENRMQSWASFRPQEPWCSKMADPHCHNNQEMHVSKSVISIAKMCNFKLKCVVLQRQMCSNDRRVLFLGSSVASVRRLYSLPLYMAFSAYKKTIFQLSLTSFNTRQFILYVGYVRLGYNILPPISYIFMFYAIN